VREILPEAKKTRRRKESLFVSIDESLLRSNGVGMDCGETLEAAEIYYVHGEYVVDCVHVHRRGQTRIVHLNSLHAVLHHDPSPFSVHGLAVW
jgi:hypothetical protein